MCTTSKEMKQTTSSNELRHKIAKLTNLLLTSMIGITISSRLFT